MRAFVAIRNAMSAMHATDMKLEKLSMKVDQLNARVDDILHDQSATNMEVAIQIAALNDALDEMREKPAPPRKKNRIQNLYRIIRSKNKQNERGLHRHRCKPLFCLILCSILFAPQ